MEKHANYIGGSWVPPREGSYYARNNPAHPETIIGEFSNSTNVDIDAAVASAKAAAPAWAVTPGPQRGALLFRFAQLLEESKAELARIITLEQGKPLAESTGEVLRAATEARFMAGEASRVCGQTFPSERSGVSCWSIAEPLGVVAAICPWNFPVVTPVRKIAPALAYGNTAVIKPASLTPWSAVFLMKLLEKAGLPAGVANLVTGPGSSIGDALVSDHRVNGITFTGSSEVGTRLNAMAASRLASVHLELGGKNPAIVIDYNDLEGAAQEIVTAAFLCSGQRCTALSRVIVLESQADAFVAKLLKAIERIQTGDGLLEGTTMGPLVSDRQMKTVDGYVRLGIESGAVLLAGGKPLVADPERDGYYYAPTLFDHVASNSQLANDEIFGPVLPIIRVRTAEEALSVANSTRYGLAAALFTSRSELVPRFIAALDTGMVHLNHGTASQAHVPFGGRKDSGLGAFSIGSTAQDFFTHAKVIYAKT